MSDAITQFLESLKGRLSPHSLESLNGVLQAIELPQKHCLVRSGQRCNQLFLLVQGASRSYYHKNGVEVHNWFAFEGELVGSLRNFHGAVSRENIELLEDSSLIAFDIAALKELIAHNAELATFVQKALIEHGLFLEDRLYDLHMRSAQEKFETLLRREPEIFRRVPLTYIASYLGISRETLSRLRSS
jgi:CRP-like cAMP-binding protein